jgi:uncharacterized protein (DUF2147 family)
MVRRIQFAARVCCAAVLAIVLATASARPAASARSGQSEDTGRPNTVFGNWTTEDGNGVIVIERCGAALCGRIVGIARPAGEPIPKDVHGVSQCGLTIIANEMPTGDGSWIGQITDPRSGTTYGAEIWLDARGNLRLRGFLGLPLLGQTQTWHRFTGHLTPACELA